MFVYFPRASATMYSTTSLQNQRDFISSKLLQWTKFKCAEFSSKIAIIIALLLILVTIIFIEKSDKMSRPVDTKTCIKFSFNYYTKLGTWLLIEFLPLTSRTMCMVFVSLVRFWSMFRQCCSDWITFQSNRNICSWSEYVYEHQAVGKKRFVRKTYTSSHSYYMHSAQMVLSQFSYS